MCFFSYGNRSPLKKKILRFINIVSFKTIYQELIQEKLYYLIVPFSPSPPKLCELGTELRVSSILDSFDGKIRGRGK